jgi:mannose-6-phosphate isomerase-like protein (cupin superfamily)
MTEVGIELHVYILYVLHVHAHICDEMRRVISGAGRMFGEILGN